MMRVYRRPERAHSCDPYCRSGFTLIEVVFVLAIMAIIFSLVIPNLGSLTPRYRMRTYSRRIAQSIEEMRVMAISIGKTTGIRYALDRETQYFQLLMPAPREYPDEPLAERESLVKYETPPGVRIRGVLLPGMRSGLMTDGIIEVGFAADGTTGSHIVVLEHDDPGKASQPVLAMKFNSISGILDYYSHEVDFLHHDS